MPRQDVPYGGAICRLKERIAEIWDKLGEKLHTINGVPGDGDGNVKIVSGSSAVVINNDPTQNEIAVSLDTSQLPAASVSSVNGQTGTVALDAGDIPSDGNSDVQSDIDALQTMDGALQGNINAEALARQNADSALQANINTSNGRISVLESEDANNMKLNRNQTSTGNNTFKGRLKSQGQPAYTPSQPTDDVATIGTLNAYTPMVRTSGNQIIAGNKTFKDNATMGAHRVIITTANKWKRIFTTPKRAGGIVRTWVFAYAGGGTANTYGALLQMTVAGSTEVPTLTWLVKGSTIPVDSVAATIYNGVLNIWVSKSCALSCIGYATRSALEGAQLTAIDEATEYDDPISDTGFTVKYGVMVA